MSKSYSFAERGKAADIFRKHFGFNFGQVSDNLMSVSTKTVKIDIIKFDDWLHRKVGDYEAKGQSMSGIIVEKYGQEANDFIESLI